jgi:cation diffusion facilitator family transporter
MTAELSHRDATKMRAARISVIVTLVLIVAKAVAGWLSGSLALISLATESIFDFLAVLITVLAVRVTSQPPDEDHLYGHGKFDSLAGLFQSVFLVGVSAWICYESINRLTGKTEVELDISALTLVILFCSFVLDLWRSRVLKRVAGESNSQALSVDSLHFLADALSVIVAMIGVLFAKFAGVPAADAYAALVVAGFVIFQSVRQGKDAVDALTDRYTRRSEYQEITEAIKSISGVEALRLLRVRQSGTLTYIDASVSVDRVLPASVGEKIRREIDASIHEIVPESETSIAIRPVKMENESAFETIRLITSEYGIVPHNIELSDSGNGKVIADLHIEFPSERSFEEAHAISEVIEERIQREISGIDTVYTHLEVERSQISATPMLDLSARESKLVEQIRAFVALTLREIVAVRDIGIYENRDTGELKLVLTLELPSDLTLHAAHEVVTDLERRLRKQYSNLGRVVIHTEPTRQARSEILHSP